MEKLILSKLDDLRVKDDSEKKSEWIRASLAYILQIVMPILSTAEVNQTVAKINSPPINIVKTILKEEYNDSFGRPFKVSDDTVNDVIPKVDKIIIFSGDDERHVEQVIIDFTTMKYEITKIMKDSGYNCSFVNRPRELDMLLTYHKFTNDTFVYFHKGVIYYKSHRYKSGCSRGRHCEEDDIFGECSHVRNYAVENKGIKLIITQNRDNTINVVETTSTRGINISLTHAYETDCFPFTGYFNLSPWQAYM